jgi:predicted DNA-binding transcriptional regulator AlpA
MKETTVTEKQAAKYLGLSMRTLQALRFYRRPPPYVKLGRSVRYLMSDLQAFLLNNRIDPNKDG